MFRSFFYFRQGYSLYLSWPFAFLGLASAIWIAASTLPSFNLFFPSYYFFLAVTFLLLVPLAALIGWMHFKKALSGFLKAELDVQMEASPYMMSLKTPVDLPWLRIVSELGKRNNISTLELDQIIASTERKFKVSRP